MTVGKTSAILYHLVRPTLKKLDADPQQLTGPFHGTDRGCGLTPQYMLDPILMPRPRLFGRHATNDIHNFSYHNDRFLYSFYPSAVNSVRNF